MTKGFATPQELAIAASNALNSGREDDYVALAADAARRLSTDASAWQWTGLLQRALHRHADAISSFEKAAALAPGDALIAMGLAQVKLEAGLDAGADFERAAALAPTSDALLGQAAARFAQGDGPGALEGLASILAANPNWVAGHRQWAQLSAMVGEPDRADETVDAAIAKDPSSVQLWLTKLQILELGGRHLDLCAASEEAIGHAGADPAFSLARAAALSDSGDQARAGDLFAALGTPKTIEHAIRLARHHIRRGDEQALGKLADQWMASDQAKQFWPYASMAWRWIDEDRWRWLEGDERLVKRIELPMDSAHLAALSGRLRSIHARSGRFLDQSVRGGTQTDGPLLSRIDAEIVRLKEVLTDAVRNYVRQLPPVDASHPMLSRSRDRPVRFAGSWSVRLIDAGFHTAHVHPKGWISSAFYVSVPDLDGQQGWLTVGAPPEDLDSGLPPIREFEPAPGSLVLFPSMMWHGTRPFASGERMTVAFDIAEPRP